MTLLNGTTGFVDIIDLHDWQNEQSIINGMNMIIASIEIDIPNIVPSERVAYVYNLIAELEGRLQSSVLGRVARYEPNCKHQDQHIRPRGYFTDLLLSGSYNLAVDRNTLPLENLITLLESEPNLVLSGDSGSGKSVFAMLIALWKAHQYLADEDAQLPVYLDLAKWGKMDSFEEFLTSQWQLAYHWQEWMKQKSVFFIIDNVELAEVYHPTYLSKIDDYCILPDYHGCMIAVSEVNDHINNHLSVVVNLESLKRIHIDKLGRSALNDYHLHQLESYYQSVSPKSPLWRLDYACFVIEAILEDYDLAEIRQHFAAKIVYARWKRFTKDIRLPFTFDEFLEILKYLAWHMLVGDSPKIITYDAALQKLGNPVMIDFALEMDILVYSGQSLRFESHLIQAELAAYMLFIEGAYKHLKNPQFDESGQRLPTKWDDSVTALFTVIEENQYQDILEQVDDIDPFLAINFARQNDSLFYRNHFQLIEKLLDIRQKYPESHHAVVEAIGDFPFVDDTALSLVRLMHDYQWNMQITTYALLLQLPVVVPADIVTLIRDLDRDFFDARQNLLSLQSSNQWIVHLSYLIHHADTIVRRNAICLLGIVRDSVALPALFSLIQDESAIIRQETLTAISSAIDEVHLPRLFEWLPEDFAEFTNLSEIFIGIGREVSGYIIQALDNSESAFNRQVGLTLIQMSENCVINVMGQCVKNQVELANIQFEPVEGEYAMKLHELLQRRLSKIQDTATFNRLVDDVSSVLSRNTTNPRDVMDEPATEEQGAQALKRRRVKPKKTTTENTTLPDGLRQALQNDEWLIRYKALQELSSYAPKAILPLLITASKDEDVQVRVAALDILANYSQSAEVRNVFFLALTDEDHLVIDTATDHLKTFDKVDINSIMPLLKHKNVQTVAAVIEILNDVQAAQAVPALINLLSDGRKPWLSDKTIGHYAAKALIIIGTPDALNAIKQSGFIDAPDLGTIIPPAIEHQSSDSTYKIEKSPSGYTIEQKIQLTLIALRGDRWELSQKAARYMRDLAKSLQGTNDPKVINPLEDALTDEIWTVRWVVVEALAWIKSTSSIPKMLPLLDDANWMIQVATIRALAELKAVETAPQIAVLLKSSNSGVCEAAAEALGMLKNPTSMPALNEALQSADEFVRLSAIKSIYEIQQDKSVPYLISSLKDSYNHVRWFAIKHLSCYASANELPAIVRLLSDNSGPIWEKKSISDYAIEALEHIDTPQSLAIVKDWTQ